ncbi:hypothetical protein F2P81_019608 [Scophthalmus maximus]|uniref:Uncharacterized protein n=1 Tax=Scophthalmus maximus TaxID=52904 RepID=A0A6A4SBQ2_SCOMX|nr:hypothetical protein F2P81_019608 [Scophthalmus maximus]
MSALGVDASVKRTSFDQTTYKCLLPNKAQGNHSHHGHRRRTKRNRSCDASEAHPEENKGYGAQLAVGPVKYGEQ